MDLLIELKKNRNFDSLIEKYMYIVIISDYIR